MLILATLCQLFKRQFQLYTWQKMYFSASLTNKLILNLSVLLPPTHAHLPSAINISHGKKNKVLLDLTSSYSLHVLSLFPFISKAFPCSFVIWFWPHYFPAPGPSKSPKPSLQTPKALGDAHLHWPMGNVWHVILSCWLLFSFCALSQGVGLSSFLLPLWPFCRLGGMYCFAS